MRGHPGRSDGAPVTDETPDPLTVACPDCLAPPGTGCYFGSSSDWPAGQVHAERTRVVTLRTTERGTCALCGQPMIRTPDGDAWHPVGALTTPCPVLPDPHTHWNDYAAAINSGLEPGRPGAQHFVPTPDIAQHGPPPSPVNQPRPTHSDPMQEPTP